MSGKVIWLYGMSGAGKTTLGRKLAKDLNFMFIDSDNFRNVNWIKPDFSPEGRRKYQEFLREEIDSKFCFLDRNVVVASITPYNDMREKNRELFGNNYFEVLVDCDIDILLKRDPKGLYAETLKGNIMYFTGITDNFEKGDPDFIIYTDINSEFESAKILLARIKKFLKREPYDPTNTNGLYSC